MEPDNYIGEIHIEQSQTKKLKKNIQIPISVNLFLLAFNLFAAIVLFYYFVLGKGDTTLNIVCLFFNVSAVFLLGYQIINKIKHNSNKEARKNVLESQTNQ